MKKNSIFSQRGFTPIELLFVILVIGLLVLVSIAFLNSSRLKARDAKRLVDIRRIQTGLTFYHLDTSSYPSYEEPIVLGTPQTVKLCDSGFVAQGVLCEKEYMSAVPQDPSSGGRYVYQGSADGFVIMFETEGVTELGKEGRYYAHSEVVDGDSSLK